MVFRSIAIAAAFAFVAGPAEAVTYAYTGLAYTEMTILDDPSGYRAPMIGDYLGGSFTLIDPLPANSDIEVLSWHYAYMNTWSGHWLPGLLGAGLGGLGIYANDAYDPDAHDGTMPFYLSDQVNLGPTSAFIRVSTNDVGNIVDWTMTFSLYEPYDRFDWSYASSSTEGDAVRTSVYDPRPPFRYSTASASARGTWLTTGLAAVPLPSTALLLAASLLLLASLRKFTRPD